MTTGYKRREPGFYVYTGDRAKVLDKRFNTLLAAKRAAGRQGWEWDTICYQHEYGPEVVASERGEDRWHDTDYAMSIGRTFRRAKVNGRMQPA